MIYNIEIFKSESYQKILKAVYPDLSYKEALIEEDCLILVDYLKENDCIGKIYNRYISYNYNKILYSYITPDKIIKCGEMSVYDKKLESKLLGRPITICEIVDVLNNVFDTNSFIYSNGIIGQCSKLYRFDDKSVYIEFYNKIALNKKSSLLHEQPQETIDEIAKLLN